MNPHKVSTFFLRKNNLRVRRCILFFFCKPFSSFARACIPTRCFTKCTHCIEFNHPPWEEEPVLSATRDTRRRQKKGVKYRRSVANVLLCPVMGTKDQRTETTRIFNKHPIRNYVIKVFSLSPSLSKIFIPN